MDPQGQGEEEKGQWETNTWEAGKWVVINAVDLEGWII